MSLVAPPSTDLVEMMRIIGQTSGAAIGISIVLIIFGLLGKKV